MAVNSGSPFGERLRQIRGGLSQDDAARRVGVASNTWGRYERGEREPDATFVIAVSDAFDVALEWLLNGRGPRVRNSASHGLGLNEHVLFVTIADVLELLEEERERGTMTAEETARLIIEIYQIQMEKLAEGAPGLRSAEVVRIIRRRA